MMTMINIEGSSNVAAIGYEPDYELLRIKFRDNSQYDYAGTSAQKYAALMAAPSKGKHLRQHFGGGVRLKSDPQELELKEPAAAPANPVPAVRETFAEDSCCKNLLMAAERTHLNSWICPTCSSQWNWAMVNGFKHWSPADFIEVW